MSKSEGARPSYEKIGSRGATLWSQSQLKPDNRNYFSANRSTAFQSGCLAGAQESAAEWLRIALIDEELRSP